MSIRSDEAIDAIAIIGMTGRFPGAVTLRDFWDNLRNGVESIAFFSNEELAAEGCPSEYLSHPAFVKAKGALDEVALFDAPFFGYTPKEAQLMDPQQRLFLECGWHALEDAGYDAEAYRGLVGVFAGVAFNAYLHTNVLRHPDAGQAFAYDKDFLTTRLSYKLNLRGPSVTVQTACSTSLVAICQACQSLLSFQCDIALAGGITVTSPAKSGYFYQEGGILSPDGHCRPFDARAQGTVMGSGVGLVVLKRLAEAIADGDRIRAVIRGFAVNNDGAAKIGYTAPSIDGQSQVIRLAQALAGVAPESIGYVEAHGTGTRIGDPIEVAALTQAFRAGTSQTGFCAIGSVKGNIGHLDTAAGVASLIKTVLALEHKQLPPSLNFERPNPKIDFDNSPFFVNGELREWNRGATPRRAGVSSFGIGGTNAHVVLEEAPPPERSAASSRWQLLTVSARSAPALERASAELLGHLRSRPEVNLADVAYTSHIGRKKFAHARAVVCRTHAGAIAALESLDRRYVSTGAQEADGRPIVFMFPGQGAQYPNMGRELYDGEPTFRRHVDECCALLQGPLGFDLRDVLYPDGEDEERGEERLRDTLITQAALFVVEYALAQLWMSWGVRPSALVGHSIGEYVAACLSDALSLEHALELVVVRGRLMQQAPEGSMVAVPLAEERVRELLVEELALSAVNGAGQCVVAGGVKSIEGFEARLRDEAVTYQRLRTAGAFHSPLMDGVAGPLGLAASDVPIRRIRIPYVSNLTGTWIEEADLRDPQYWARHVRETVRFGSCVDTLLAWGAGVFLEVGPGHSLGALVRMQARSHGDRFSTVSAVSSWPSAHDVAGDAECTAGALGRLWLAGVVPDWTSYHAAERRLRVELPMYPFERKRYWADSAWTIGGGRDRLSAASRTDIDHWFAIPSWFRSQPPAPAERPAQPIRWLVFVERSSPGERLTDLLEERGHEIVRVRAGRSFEAWSTGDYTVAPGSRADFDALFTDLLKRDALPERVLHLWTWGGEPIVHIDDESVTAGQTRGFGSLLAFAQAYGDRASTVPMRLAIVADAVHDVTGRDAICAEKATVMGAVRVLPQEYPNVDCRLIDVPGERTFASARLFDQLVREVESDAKDPLAAYRGVDRWLPAFERVALSKVAGRPGLVREDGVYLITGGYGAIGLELARYLTSVGKPKLVLVGRTGVPARELWQKHVALHGRDDAVSRRIRAVQALEESGAEVMAARGDVADESQMRGVIGDAIGRFGRIHGVIHAAGVAGGGVMQLRDANAVRAVMRPKVFGTRVLHRLLSSQHLDFMVLCSSLNATGGGVGQADYCGANAYLDAFARDRSANGANLVISINWDAWREAGMSAEARLPAGLVRERQQTLSAGLTAAEGIDAFARCLAAGQPQVLVSTGGWARSRFEEQPPASETVETAAVDDVPLNPRPNLPTPYVAPEDDVHRKICNVWRDALGIEQVGVHDSFFDLGGHSLLAIQVVARVNADFGTKIPVAKLYEGLTPAFLANLISGTRPVEGADASARERQERVARQRQLQERRRIGKAGQGSAR